MYFHGPVPFENCLRNKLSGTDHSCSSETHLGFSVLLIISDWNACIYTALICTLQMLFQLFSFQNHCTMMIEAIATPEKLCSQFFAVGLYQKPSVQWNMRLNWDSGKASTFGQQDGRLCSGEYYVCWISLFHNLMKNNIRYICWKEMSSMLGWSTQSVV